MSVGAIQLLFYINEYYKEKGVANECYHKDHLIFKKKWNKKYL